MQYIVNSDLYFKKLTYEYQPPLMIDEQLTYVFLIEVDIVLKLIDMIANFI